MNVRARKIGLASGLVLAFSAAVCRPVVAEDNGSAIAVASPDTAIAAAASPRAFTGMGRLTPLVSPTVSPAVNSSSSFSSSTASADLPDAPEPAVLVEPAPMFGYQASGATGTASIYTKYIPSGWTAQKITAHDKVIIGLRDLYSPLNAVAIVASAGYSDITNGEPNYGSDGTAFAKRVGAAAVRETSQGLFTDCLFSPLLHEDPRYYIEGSQYGFFHRSFYAISRPLITRTDGGHSSLNGALLLGYAGAAALTPAYYPQVNRNFRDTASTYGGSIGGAALGFFVTEFSDDLLKFVHMKK